MRRGRGTDNRPWYGERMESSEDGQVASSPGYSSSICAWRTNDSWYWNSEPWPASG